MARLSLLIHGWLLFSSSSNTAMWHIAMPVEEPSTHGTRPTFERDVEMVALDPKAGGSDRAGIALQKR